MLPFVLVGVVLFAAFALSRRRDEEPDELELEGGGTFPPQGGGAAHGGGAGELLGGQEQADRPTPELVDEADQAAIGRPLPAPSGAGALSGSMPAPECVGAYRRYRGVFKWPTPSDRLAEWLLLEVWDGNTQGGAERGEIEETIKHFWTGVFPHGVWALGVECNAEDFDMYMVASGQPGVPPLG